MPFDVSTKDCSQLTDSELAEMADLCAETPSHYEIGDLSKQAEAWVLVTQVREGELLRGFSFSTSQPQGLMRFQGQNSGRCLKNFTSTI